MDKKTKIIATISDKHCEPEFIRALYEAGMNAARINSAHLYTPESGRHGGGERAESVGPASPSSSTRKGPRSVITGMAPGLRSGHSGVDAGTSIRLRGTSGTT